MIEHTHLSMNSTPTCRTRQTGTLLLCIATLWLGVLLPCRGESGIISNELTGTTSNIPPDSSTTVKDVAQDAVVTDDHTTDVTPLQSATTARTDLPPRKEEDTKPAEDEPVLREGDSVEVVVFEDPTFNGVYKVRAGGYIMLPQIGNFKVGRLKAGEAEKALKTRLEKDLLRKATVSVIASPQGQPTRSGGVVYVIGEVKSPGVLGIPGGESLTMLTAIIRAGGLTDHADPSQVQLARLKNGRRDISFMHFDATLAGVESGTELLLQDGDIVNIIGREGIDLEKPLPPSRGTVYLSGQVKSPGPHDIQDVSVYKTLLRNNGFERFANLKKVYVIREEKGTKIKIPVNVKDIVEKGALELDIPVKPGDIIVVPEKFFSF